MLKLCDYSSLVSGLQCASFSRCGIAGGRISALRVQECFTRRSRNGTNSEQQRLELDHCASGSSYNGPRTERLQIEEGHGSRGRGSVSRADVAHFMLDAVEKKPTSTR